MCVRFSSKVIHEIIACNAQGELGNEASVCHFVCVFVTAVADVTGIWCPQLYL